MGWSGAGRHLLRLEVIGRPAVFATAAEADWKAAVKKAVAESGIAPPSGRFQRNTQLGRTTPPATMMMTGAPWSDAARKPTTIAMLQRSPKSPGPAQGALARRSRRLIMT
jgi:hypothetical protein